MADALQAADWQPIASVPHDGKPVLVWLARPMLGSRIHAATYLPNLSIVGGAFAFDAPKATHWRPQPAPPADEVAPQEADHAE